MTVFQILVQDQYGNPIPNASVRVIDYIDVEEGETDGDGIYTTGDLPFPTAFMNADFYHILADYWTATSQAPTDIYYDTEQPVVLVLPLYEGSGQTGGEGEKTLTITANPAECNHILAVNNTKETQYVFASFPGAFKFDVGDSISLTAYPQSGYEFVHWDDNYTIDENNPATDVWVDDGEMIAVLNYVGIPGGSSDETIELPKPVIVFGSVFVSEKDVVECNVHLGATKEVSSFAVKLQNWGKKYSPSGWMPITVGATGGIGICRIPNNPNVLPLISLKVEKLEYESSPTESYVRVSGRCWGEKLFRRTVTKIYANEKGEDIVKDLIINYVGLSHTRGGVELIEDTDTTYTKLEYVDTPVWDILAYVASTSDKNGVIGFDFRVAPDGKFEFFPRNSKANNVDLIDRMETSKYSKDITAVRNKITIYGAAEKCIPENKDDWTAILSTSDGEWTAWGQNASVAQDNTVGMLGAGSIKCHINNGWFGQLIFTFNSGHEVNADLYPKLNLFILLQATLCGKGAISLIDTSGKQMVLGQSFKNDSSNWLNVQVDVGSKNADKWVPGITQTGFDWTHIKKVKISCIVKEDLTAGSGDYWVDSMYFTGRRFSSMQEDGSSQYSYGLREIH